ncbi:MAG: DUF86 domain-containing protein [Spirochaetales bacterium]|nr:DUF86 domain-containing protein [Spirochaetales bacterium]
MKKEYSDSLNDIVKSMNLSQKFIKDHTLDSFNNDDKTKFVVIRCLEIIGEATKRLPEILREANPEIPWKAMTKIQNHLFCLLV